MQASKNTFVIGIAGGSGSGKSCLVEGLVQRYSSLGVTVLDQDSYYRDLGHLSTAERERANFDDPHAIDHDLIARHLEALICGETVHKPVYSFLTHTRTGAEVEVAPKPLILVEGLFALWDARVRATMDLKLFVHADADLRLIRRIHRDVAERGRSIESVIQQYLASVRPMYLQHVEPTKAYADAVLSNGGSIEDLLADVEPLVAKAMRRRVFPPVMS